jgi:hypothetical protein
MNRKQLGDQLIDYLSNPGDKLPDLIKGERPERWTEKVKVENSHVFINSKTTNQLGFVVLFLVVLGTELMPIAALNHLSQVSAPLTGSEKKTSNKLNLNVCRTFKYKHLGRCVCLELKGIT